MRAFRYLVLAAISTLSLAVSVDAQSSPNARRRAARFPEFGTPELEAYALTGFAATLASTRDLEPFRVLVGDASVVGLGESWHTSGGFYLMKHRLFRFLVEEMGFRAFAVESNWESVERMNAYVQSCAGTAEASIRDQHTVWQSTEYADLIRWMCEWNRSHSDPADRLTAFGFDIQQPEKDGPALAAFLAQVGLPESDARVNGLRSCERAFGLTHTFGEIPPAVHATCIDSLGSIESFLQTHRIAIVERTSQQAFDVAMLRVIGMRAYQEQTFSIRDDFPKGFSARDVGMAYAFHARRAMTAPHAKTALWAADIHIAQNPLPNGERPLGSHLESVLGADYVSFAITAYESERPLSPGVCGLAARKAGSAEEHLATYGQQTLLARPRDGVRQYQVMPMGAYVFRPFADFDGIFFLAHSPAMHPLLYKGCR